MEELKSAANVVFPQAATIFIKWYRSSQTISMIAQLSLNNISLVEGTNQMRKVFLVFVQFRLFFKTFLTSRPPHIASSKLSTNN